VPASAGSGSVRADFNGDGFTDLAVAVIGEDVGGVVDAGGVNVIYGSAGGPTATGNQFWSQDSPGIDEVAEEGDEFGRSLATGDFNGDGFADLAVGVPHEDRAGEDDGGVHVIYGSATGLTSAGSQFWSQDTAGIPGVADSPDSFGASLAAADFGSSSHADLAVGAPGEALGVVSAAGVVHVLYGSSAGLTANGNQLWSQSSAGISGAVEPDDAFGVSLAAADFGNSVHADLAIGASGEALGRVFFAGGVHVIYGSVSGLTATGSQFWTQDSPGISGVAESSGGNGDLFGRSLAAANFGNSAHADLAMGVPSEDIGDIGDAGGINVLYGSPTGLTAAGNQFSSQDTPGITGKSESSSSNETFGWSLAAANFGKSADADLAVGVPGEDVVGVRGVGVVHVIYGSVTGLTTVDDEFWHQDSPGITGAAEAFDNFGFSLAAANIGNSSHADLAVGVPFEDIGDIDNAGVAHIIYGSATGLTPVDDEFWSQNSPSIEGDAASGDRYGDSVATRNTP
jgi:FG-GAP repeat